MVTYCQLKTPLKCRRWDSNPHALNGHWILNPARLPIPPLRQAQVIFADRYGSVNDGQGGDPVGFGVKPTRRTAWHMSGDRGS